MGKSDQQFFSAYFSRDFPHEVSRYRFSPSRLLAYFFSHSLHPNAHGLKQAQVPCQLCLEVACYIASRINNAYRETKRDPPCRYLGAHPESGLDFVLSPLNDANT